MNGADLGSRNGQFIVGAMVVAAVVAVCLWELAQWVFRHLRVEWIA